MVSKLWGEIKEVDQATAMANLGVWHDLKEEIMMRLEQTKPGKALSVPFETLKLAELARTSLKRCFEASTPGKIAVTVKKNDFGATLFVGWAEEKQPLTGPVKSARSRRKSE